MWRLLALLLLLIPAPAAAFPNIEKVAPYLVCGGPKGNAGTGVQLSEKYVATAWHVIEAGECIVNGIPAKMVYQEPGIDFAVLELAWPTDDYWHLGITCQITFGAGYRAYGYNNGNLYALKQTALYYRPVSDGTRYDKMVIFKGAYQLKPGMSGGPMVERETGKVAAINVAYDLVYTNLSGARPLADTPLCNPASEWYMA